MNSNMVKPETFGHLYLFYHFTVPLISGGECHVSENKIGNTSIRNGHHIDKKKVTVVNLVYLVHKIQAFYHTGQTSSITCVTLSQFNSDKNFKLTHYTL